MPQNEGQSREIDGVTYTVYHLPPRKARDMTIDIGKALGPSFGRFIDSFQTSGSVDVFAEGFRDLFDRLSKDMLNSMMEEMSAVSEADGVRLKGIFDVHFLGRVGPMFKWFRFALEVNFQDFFSIWKDVMSQFQEALAQGSSSQSTSTG